MAAQPYTLQQKVTHRGTTERWSLLTVETEANGDSRGPSLVGSGARRALPVQDILVF
jgi:hypothetical protein